MAAPDPEVLAEEVAHLSRTATTRVTRLSPGLRGPFQRLLLSDATGEVEAAVERYYLAAERAESHLDAGAREALEEADAALAKHLTGAGRDEELLRRELAQRRAALLTDPATLEAEAEQARRQAAQRFAAPVVVDVVAARLQSRFLAGIRALAAKGAGAWTPAERLLLRAFRKLRSVIGGSRTEGWEAVFAYLRANEAGLAERAQELRRAVDELAAAEAAGDAARVAQAKAALTRARQQVGGYRSKLKGLLGEAYVPRWQAWLVQVQGYLEVARRVAARLPGEWEVLHVTGSIRLDGKEVWDEAILLVRRGQPGRAPQARLFLAAQFKVEKEVSALAQVENDVLRETATGAATTLPVLTFDQAGRTEPFLLTPMPAGETANRFVFNAGGASSTSKVQHGEAMLDVVDGNGDAVAVTLDPPAVAKVKVGVHAVGVATAALTFSLECTRSPARLASWQNATHDALFSAWSQWNQEWQAARQRSALLQTLPAGESSGARNLQTVRDELKRQVVSWLLEESPFAGRPALQPLQVGNDGKPVDTWQEMDIAKARADAPTIQFLEQAFDWSIMTYVFYPYYWADRDHWDELSELSGVDPDFERFLKSGSARVVVPARPGMEPAVHHWLLYQEPFLGHPMPLPNEPMYVSVATEIRDLTRPPEDGEPGDSWEARIGTTLLLLDDSDKLPANPLASLGKPPHEPATLLCPAPTP